MIKKIIYSIALLACINSCKYYTLPVKDFANQLSKLQVIKERKMSITAGKHKTVKFENYYVNNLNYLYCFDENGKGDSV